MESRPYNIEIANQSAVDQLIADLKSSIVDYNHLQFQSALGELTSERYRDAFKIDAPIDHSGSTLLSLAIANANLPAIKQLLLSGANKKRLDADTLNKALLTSIRSGEYLLMVELLEIGADASHRIDKSGISTLHVAAMYGRTDAIEKLLSLNLSPFNHDNHGDTPLSIAVKRDDIDAVRIFIDSILNKRHPADNLLKMLHFNRQFEYLLNCVQSKEVTREICRLITYLEQKGIPLEEIKKLIKDPIRSDCTHPFMKDHETVKYYETLTANKLTTYRDHLADYYKRFVRKSATTLALDSQDYDTIKAMILFSGSNLSTEQLDKLSNNTQLLPSLEKVYPASIDRMLTNEIGKLLQLTKNNDIAGLNNVITRIFELVSTNPERLDSVLYKHLSQNYLLRTCLITSKKTGVCFALMRFLDHFEAKQDADLKELLPEKYTFANSYLKEDIFASIKKLPITERIKKYDQILHQPNSAYYRIFHMKRGYVWGVSEKRGILHDVAQAYEKDRKNSGHWNQEMIAAFKKRNVDKVIDCINNGADVNLASNELLFQFPIMEAASIGNVKLVEFLLQRGADTNTLIDNPTFTHNHRCGILFSGVQSNSHEVVSFLLRHGVNPNLGFRASDNNSPLMYAIDKSEISIVKLLLDNSASIDTFGNDRISFLNPLSLATRQGSEKILELLVDHMINHYSIERIVKFLEAHDNLKTCLKRAGENSELLKPLQKLMKHLVSHNVPSEILDTMLQGSTPVPEKIVEAKPAQVIPRLYPDLNEPATPQTDALQQYMEQSRQRQTAPAQPVLLNPFTDAPLPRLVATESSADAFALIDVILNAPAVPKQPSWITCLEEIDFSTNAMSSTAAVMQQLGDLITFEEPITEKPYVNPFDELIEQEKKVVAAKPGYQNPFDEMTEDQHDSHVAAQLAALPPAPQGLGIFAARIQESSIPTEKSKTLMAAKWYE